MSTASELDWEEKEVSSLKRKLEEAEHRVRELKTKLDREREEK